MKIEILAIPQIPKHLWNFLDSHIFGKFPRVPGIWGIPEISQIPIGIEGGIFLRFWKFLK